MTRTISLTLCTLLLTICSESPTAPPFAGVLIVTLDTTRADRLPSYGFTGVATPALDRLSREGTVFEQAVSVAPLTLPAHCSLFTGLFPMHHRVRDNADPPLDRRRGTLAEMLRTKGYQTAAFIGSDVLRADRGVARGFDLYIDGQRDSSEILLRRSAAAVVDDAVGWLRRRNTDRFMVWVHLYDAHAPYDLPEPYRTLFADAPYLGAIAFMDAQIGRLLDVLDRSGAGNRTLIVVAGDHGESLGDHGEESHGILLYESTLHVPLIVRTPGLVRRRVSSIVRLVDVMPTVLDLAGVRPTNSDGASLVPLLTGRSRDLGLEAYSESWYPRRFGWSPLRSLRGDRFKLIDGPQPELYDLVSDPFEAHDIIAERPGLAMAMARRLSRFEDESRREGESKPRKAAEASDDVLASLGYVTGGSNDSPLPRASSPNPREHISEYNRIVRRHRGGACSSIEC
jgi:arylsulfatase A-like enzyme